MSRSVARRGASDQYGRSQIADFLCPDNGFRGKQIRNGIKPKNHMKENLQLLQGKGERLREQKEEEMYAREKKDLYKLSQFRHVESRVYDDVSPVPLKETSENFLQKGSERRRRLELQKGGKEARAQVERKMAEARELTDQPASPRKAAVPKEDGVLQHRDIDFISTNRRGIQRMVPSPRKIESNSTGARHESFGKNPKYLEERKQQMKEDENLRRRNAPDPDCPKGMRLMPDDERLKTLESLQTSKAEVLKLLSKLPFVLDSLSSRKKQEVYERKLKEIEGAIDIFKKPKVFIAKE